MLLPTPLANIMPGAELAKAATGKGKSTMSMIGGALGLAWSLGGFFDIVHYGEAAAKKRLGSFEHLDEWRQFYSFPPYVETHAPGVRYGLKKRGIAFSLPMIDRWIRVSTLPNSDNELEPQRVRTDMGRYMHVDGAITWQVIDEERAIYLAIKAVNTNRATDVTPHLKELVIRRAGEHLVATMSKKSLDQMENLTARKVEFLERCADKSSTLSLMGVTVDSATLRNPYVTDADRALEAAEKIAETNFRAAQELAASNRYTADILAAAVRDAGEYQAIAALAVANGLQKNTDEFLRTSPQGRTEHGYQVVPFPMQRDAAEGQF